MPEMPPGWVREALGEIASIGSGEALPESLRQGPFPLMGANGRIGSAALSNFTGGFLVGRVGAAGAVTDISFSCWASDNTLTVRANRERVSHKYLGFLLHHLDLAGLATRNAQPLVTQTQLRAQECRIPASVAEQQLIAHILDTLDTQIRRTEALIAKLEQIKQGLLTDLLTRGIDENGQPRPPTEKAPHLYKDSQLGLIPCTWNTLQLDQMTGSPICYGIVQVGSYVQDGVPVVAIRDLGGDFTTNMHRAARSVEAPYSRSRINEGDVLLSVKGTTGRVGVAPKGFEGNISRDIARLRPNEMTDSRFLCYLLDSEVGRRALALAEVGTTRAELSIGRLRNVNVFTPPLDEQRVIASTVDKLVERLQVESAALDALRRLKTGLMDDLLTGRVRVTPLLDVSAQATG